MAFKPPAPPARVPTTRAVSEASARPLPLDSDIPYGFREWVEAFGASYRQVFKVGAAASEVVEMVSQLEKALVVWQEQKRKVGA